MRWAGLVDAGGSWNHDGPVCSLVELEEQVTTVVVMSQQDAVPSIDIYTNMYHEGIVGVSREQGNGVFWFDFWFRWMHRAIKCRWDFGRVMGGGLLSAPWVGL